MKNRLVWAVLGILLFVACGKNSDAFVVLNVDSADTPTRTMIASLQVTIGDVTRAFLVDHSLPATLGIVTAKTGDMTISVVGLGARPLGKWRGIVSVLPGRTVSKDVVLACDGSDCGSASDGV
jgi:hypothetical protein